MTKTTFEKVAAGLLEAVAASRGIGPATRASTIVNVRIKGSDLSALDAWRSTQPNPPTRPEAIRYALQEWLISQGFFKNREDSEGAN